MESDGSLPLVTFGKYKGKPITEMLQDTNYVEWCKQQEFFKRHTTIYNIVVNQSVNTQTTSKTPEHNRIQNLFLDKANIILFYKHVCQQYKYKSFLFEALDKECRQATFEGCFNWDIIIKGFYFKNGQLRWTDQCSHQKLVGQIGDKRYPNCTKENPGGLNSCCAFDSDTLSDSFIEVKPLLGDDYPAVLRKMTQQRTLTETENRGWNPRRYFLLIKDFQSSTTTREQLVDIFQRSKIVVCFLNDIFQDEVLSIASDDRVAFLENRVRQLEAMLRNMGVKEDLIDKTCLQPDMSTCLI
jgi:hypothetical protein